MAYKMKRNTKKSIGRIVKRAVRKTARVPKKKKAGKQTRQWRKAIKKK